MGGAQCGRPVKWIGSRSEALLGDNHGRDQVVDAELALDGAGKILAVRAHALHGVGSYIASAAVAPLLYRCAGAGVYDVRTLWLTTKAVFTHTTPLSVYRGAGRPEGIYLIERLIEEAAAKIGQAAGRDPARNFIAPEKMPYATATDAVYDSGEFERLMNECMALADWKGYRARQALSKRNSCADAR